MREISVSGSKCTNKKQDKLSSLSKLKVAGKVKKTRNSKYKNQTEKTDGKNERNRASYYRCKLRNKIKSGIQDVVENFDTTYRKRMFLGLRGDDYQVMVTLTNTELITIKKHDCNIKRMLTWLKELGFIKNSFKVNEYDGYNYHSHILMNLNVSIRSLTGRIKKYWQKKYGYIDVLKIDGQEMKERVIKYCLKQLKPTSSSNRKQELVDTWEIQPELTKPTPVADLFKNELFLKSIHSVKDIRNRKVSKCIMLEPTPLEKRKKATKKNIRSGNELLGIY